MRIRGTIREVATNDIDPQPISVEAATYEFARDQLTEKLPAGFQLIAIQVHRDA